jgi:hypothetical protein
LREGIKQDFTHGTAQNDKPTLMVLGYLRFGEPRLLRTGAGGVDVPFECGQASHDRRRDEVRLV